MVFNSVSFLFAFLPAVYVIYLILPGIKLKNTLLVFASLLFYAWGEQLYVLLMLGSVFINWLAGLAIFKFNSHKKGITALAVILNIGMLGVFKYAGFFADALSSLTGLDLPGVSIHLPIGISFFTFQILSYVIDVSRDKNAVQKNFFLLLLYISLFPQLIAGPIVKYHDVMAQLSERKLDINKIAPGVRRFIIGLSKKVLLADVLAVAVDDIFASDPSSLSGYCLWMGSVFYALQIYFDFSGYSDMAIGIGKMFGFDFKENFTHPYASTDITVFWRNWHISLSTWFREYLYIPLGGNRKGKFRTYLNLFIVFLATGIWHGANFTFILWGVYNGILIIFERMGAIPVKKIKCNFIKHFYTLFAVVIGFTLFRADSLSYAAKYLKNMFTPSSFLFGATDALAQLSPYVIVTFVAACVACFPVINGIKTKLSGLPAKTVTAVNALSYVVCFGMFVVCALVIASDSYSPFIYFRF